MGKSTIELKIPSEVEDIKLGMYQQYIKLVEGLGDTPVLNEFTKMKMVSIFCNVPFELVRLSFKTRLINVVIKAVQPLLDSITNDKSNDEAYQFEPTFSIGETKFGFINEFEDMMAGEFADLSTYFVSWDNIHKAMAVMYRPVIKEKENKILKIIQYDIEEYKGTNEYANLMKQMPAIKVIEASFFLTNSFIKLRKCTLAYMANQLETNPEIATLLKDNSIEIGDGIKHFTALETILH